MEVAFTSPRHAFMHVLRTRLNELPNHSSNDPRPPQRRVKYEGHFVPLLHRIRLRVDRDDAVVEVGEEAEKGSSIWG